MPQISLTGCMILCLLIPNDQENSILLSFSLLLWLETVQLDIKLRIRFYLKNQ
jgi:hypothetical protein